MHTFWSVLAVFGGLALVVLSKVARSRSANRSRLRRQRREE
ncbi:hypothetical protein ACEZCY_22270 [Streptacidiphilus sp. N1-12]|uniref:Uncharacterized protein n=2 Tax=Streptacidiphilus alkalitolerans TaxID=3342712 RepID=A0ABV6VE40_9ACTN